MESGLGKLRNKEIGHLHRDLRVRDFTRVNKFSTAAFKKDDITNRKSNIRLYNVGGAFNKITEYHRNKSTFFGEAAQQIQQQKSRQNDKKSLNRSIQAQYEKDDADKQIVNVTQRFSGASIQKFRELKNGIDFSENRPAFVSEKAIRQYTDCIRQEVHSHLLAGIKLFVKGEGLGEAALEVDGLQQAWLWAVKSSKYNAVYYVSRTEAAEGITFVKQNARLIDTIGDFLDNRGGVARIANYALHSYVQDFAKTPERNVRIAKKSIPRYAIQGYDQNTLVVKDVYFLKNDPKVSFNTSKDLLDWHDLSHILAASSSNGAFGVKYHEGLDKLDRYYRAITEGKGMQDASGPRFSDGMLLTQLSRAVFESYEAQKLPDGTNSYNYNQIQGFITKELFAYLGGEHALYHPGVNAKVKGERMIDALELAVCIQNKRYERRAAEMEKELFVRGTPEGPRGNPTKDPLAGLTRS